MHIRKTLAITIAAVCLSLTGAQHAIAQTGKTAEIQRLEADMYRYFATDSVETFIDVTKRLKSACLAAGDEQTFYKTWANQAIFYFNRYYRSDALKTLKDLHDYAEWHNSKYGLFTATYASGTIHSGMQQFAEAEKSYRQAIDYLHRYFPKESTAAPYLALAKIDFSREDYDKVMGYAERALLDPACTQQHALSAYSYICMALARKGINGETRDRFNHAYAEREAIMQEVGHDDSFGQMVGVYRELVNGHPEQALEKARQMRVGSERLELISTIYANMGNYKEAYEWNKRYREFIDSTSTKELRQLSIEYANQLNLDRAESESEGLRSANLYLMYTIVAVVALALLVMTLYHRRQVRRLLAVNRQLEASEQSEHEARQQAEKALNVKRHFLNNVSHEMRTPLNSINGFTEVLTMPGMELPQDEKDDLRQRISESTVMLTGIIDRMLELSYYDSLTELECNDVVRVNELCRRLLSEYDGKTAPGVIKSYTSLLPDTATVTTNRAGLERVIHHVLDNATTFTAQGRINFHSALSDGTLILTVSDTGPGIAPEMQKAVFEQFVDTGAQVKAAGMGLSISKNICRLLGGDIYVDSDYTKGCRIVVRLKAQTSRV